jgi:hypothetical protein
MPRTKKRPAAGGGGDGKKRGGPRPGSGRPFGSGTTAARLHVPVDVAEMIEQLGEFFGVRAHDLGVMILGGLVRELHGAIGEAGLRRYATLEAARLLVGMDDGQRRLAHYKFVTQPGLDLDVAEDNWAEVVELADATPSGRIVAEIDALRRDASAALERLKVQPLPSCN